MSLTDNTTCVRPDSEDPQPDPSEHWTPAQMEAHLRRVRRQNEIVEAAHRRYADFCDQWNQRVRANLEAMKRRGR